MLDGVQEWKPSFFEWDMDVVFSTWMLCHFDKDKIMELLKQYGKMACFPGISHLIYIYCRLELKCGNPREVPGKPIHVGHRLFHSPSTVIIIFLIKITTSCPTGERSTKRSFGVLRRSEIWRWDTLLGDKPGSCQGPVSISDKTSFREISWSLEVARLVV